MAGMLYMYVYQQTVKPSERYMDQTEDHPVEDLSVSDQIVTILGGLILGLVFRRRAQAASNGIDNRVDGIPCHG